MNLVWDFGGVLFQWRPPDLVRRTLPHRADRAEHWAATIFQSWDGDWREFDLGLIDQPEVVRRIAARTGLPEAEVQAAVDGVADELQPIARSVALLARLHAQGVPQYYLSNMAAPLADHLQALHPFIGWFADGVFSGRVKQAKPDRAVFELAAARFGHDPAELLFFDDHLPNVEAARAAGWQAEHFSDAGAAAAILRDRGILKD